MMALTAQGISCAIGTNQIIDDVDVAAPRHKMTAILGRNGSGKSTLLRALAAITAPTAGTVALGTDDLYRFSARERARRIAFVAQEEMPAADLTVAEFVALGRIPYRRPWEVGGKGELELVRACLDHVGLLDKMHRGSADLSGGERRRAALARAFAQDCEVMLLDEPTNHLDIESQLRLLELLRSSGRTIIAAVHDLDLAMTYFDQVYVLHEHKVLASGPPRDVLTPQIVATAFGVSATVTVSTTGTAHLVCEALDGGERK